MMKIESNPPLLYNYRQLLRHWGEGSSTTTCANVNRTEVVMEEEWELPVIDIGGLRSGDDEEREACAAAIVEASSKWGFFQVVNHGISLELLRKMRRDQVKLFNAPFEKKANCGVFNHSYRWGTPTATCSQQFSWSEAFHIPLSKIPEEACYGEFSTLREVMVEYARAMQELARTVAGVLVQKLGQQKRAVFEENCSESTCFLRLNHYPACPISPEVLGLVPHTDTSFLTILHQDDQVGGFQLIKDSNWVPVKPHHNTLIINIGDLFQAWSNDVYKSVEHKVITDKEVDRYSVAYFLCPSQDSIIGSCRQPSIYRKFTFGEYKQQTQQDVKMSGRKVGLSRFLL